MSSLLCSRTPAAALGPQLSGISKPPPRSAAIACTALNLLHGTIHRRPLPTAQVTIVGKVLGSVERGGNLDMQVSDGTGAIDVSIYIDTDTDVRRAVCMSSQLCTAPALHHRGCHACAAGRIITTATGCERRLPLLTCPHSTTHNDTGQRGRAEEGRAEPRHLCSRLRRAQELQRQAHHQRVRGAPHPRLQRGG